MFLLPFSVVIGILGFAFKTSPPPERNWWYGFRTRKSLASKENWVKAQVLFWQYSLKFLRIIIVVGIVGLVVEIIGLWLDIDAIIISGFVLELVVMTWYLFTIYWKVEKEL
ncbi:SdpI family protein [Staphylococcus devriesei]|uniref:Uncharacterized protein n=1 Tax=Staphylococcus devriesei TaxID=586733 RepID=A0A2T4KG28_9STAP|nr:SdpI family protein [Staphylococcus devriesei]PTE71907.1 hypothetical protein BUY44_08835 [Staphylococcus devriesei]RIL73389.1 SdpI family protein [Staphylococcus devriesei]WKU14410.1 SdpI family protein [Staphylococcus devriesei]